MKYQLIKPMNKNYSTIEQILTNRNIPLAEVSHYLNTTDDDINDFNTFGQDNLIAAAVALTTSLSAFKKILVIVDPDCDGFTASALLINYLYDLFPSLTEENIL